MIEVKLLVDCIDYDSVVDLLMPVVGDKLQAKGGIVGKIGGKKEKLTKMAHKLLGKVSQEKKDQTIVDLATKKQAMIVVCRPEDSEEWYEKMWRYSVELFRNLDIPVHIQDEAQREIANKLYDELRKIGVDAI